MDFKGRTLMMPEKSLTAGILENFYINRFAITVGFYYIKLLTSVFEWGRKCWFKVLNWSGRRFHVRRELYSENVTNKIYSIGSFKVHREHSNSLNFPATGKIFLTCIVRERAVVQNELKRKIEYRQEVFTCLINIALGVFTSLTD